MSRIAIVTDPAANSTDPMEPVQVLHEMRSRFYGYVLCDMSDLPRSLRARPYEVISCMHDINHAHGCCDWLSYSRHAACIHWIFEGDR